MGIQLGSAGLRDARFRKRRVMNDKQLQQAVIDELDWEPSVDASDIGVTASNGVVTLSGYVPTFWQKRKAEWAAQRVKGVKALVEEIEVKLRGEDRWADDTIAERALQSLASDAAVPKDRITLKVEDGWVTLSGEVDWHFQKTAAEHDVHNITGVRGLSNQISIKPQVQRFEVRAKIAKALARTAALDAAAISIQTDDGNVTLRGKVHSLSERRLVEDAAWSAPGVTEVNDRLTVGV
ncbi:MAG TPA: BON domain-containing protein [Candidatus Limnocylindria bacterium]